MAESVFDTFDFTPVADNPFKRGQGAVSPVVSEYEKGQPAAPAPSPTDDSSYWDPRTWFSANPNATFEAGHAMSPESWAHYAGNPAHPMAGRIGSAVVEEARRFGTGLTGDINQLMGPVYGEGHYPTFNEQPETGAPFAGAGVNLASMMGGPGSETGVGAGWNLNAEKFLKGLQKQKPPLLPETASVVQKMIDKGPEWGWKFFDETPEGTPGKGFAQIATTKHLMEEAAKPKPPPVVTPAATQAAEASLPYIQGGPFDTSKYMKPPVTVAQPGTGLPVAAGSPASVKGPPPTKPVKAPKTVKATELSPEEALFGGVNPITQDMINRLSAPDIKPLNVPTMKTFDPTKTGQAALSHETAPGTSGQTLPFNPSGLPMDTASKVQRMQELGYGPLDNQILWWRGVKPHGPYSWDSAAVGYKDPITKEHEPGLYFHPDVNAAGKPGAPNAQLYGANLNPHVLKSSNPLILDWKKETKNSLYSQDKMKKLIKDAWAKGHDALLLKNIGDIGGKHDQLVVRYPHQLRHPQAAFDPKYKGTANLLAARGTGGVPMLMQDKDLEGPSDVTSPIDMYNKQQQQLKRKQMENMPTPPHTPSPYLLPAPVREDMRQMTGLPKAVQDYMVQHPSFEEGQPQVTRDLYDEGAGKPPGPTSEAPDISRLNSLQSPAYRWHLRDSGLGWKS